MGLFEVSSWGEGGEIKEKRKRSQKKKKGDDKQQSNIILLKKSKVKKKKKDLSSAVNTLENQTRQSESPKKKHNVEKRNRKKLQKINERKSSKLENAQKKNILKGFFKPVSNQKSIPQSSSAASESKDKNQLEVAKIKQKNVQKRKRKNILQKNLTNSSTDVKKAKNKYPLKVNSTLPEPQKANSEPLAITSKSKKRKRELGEEKLEQGTRNKKKKKSKENNLSGNVSKTESSDKSPNRKMNFNKLQELLNNKKQEKKTRTVLSLRERMLAQLRSSRFRYLNETLYSNESTESKKYFKDDPEAFTAYHEGYKQQVAHWPLNPLDTIIASINKMCPISPKDGDPKDGYLCKNSDLDNHISEDKRPKDYIVADFGCGEAKLAESVSQKVESFDFIAVNDKVKACDMAHTPLLTNGVNVVVFCLSLMGTNLQDYLLEANRVLKKGGIMKIAEVESRFDNIENFIGLVAAYGFVNTWTDLSNDLFYFLDFRKDKEVEREKKKKLPAIELKPCLYKKR